MVNTKPSSTMLEKIGLKSSKKPIDKKKKKDIKGGSKLMSMMKDM